MHQSSPFILLFLLDHVQVMVWIVTYQGTKEYGIEFRHTCRKEWNLRLSLVIRFPMVIQMIADLTMAIEL